MNVSVHGLKNEIYSCVTRLFSYSCVLKTRLFHVYKNALISDHGLKNEVYFIFMCIKNILISVHGLKNEVLFSYSCVLKTRLFRFMD